MKKKQQQSISLISIDYEQTDHRKGNIDNSQIHDKMIKDCYFKSTL